MRLHCVVDLASGWIPKQIHEGFCRFTTHEPVANPGEADLIWIESYYADLNGISRPPGWWRLAKRLGVSSAVPRMRRRPDVSARPILVSLHHLVEENAPAFRPILDRVDHLADAYHFFSDINIPTIQRHVSRPGFHLPYWIDLEAFFPLAADARKAKRVALGLPESRMIIGSFQRDTEADRISPKLAKGPDLLCDVLERMDRNRIFALLSGPRRDYVENRLTRANIPYLSLGYVGAEEMNALYGALDVYLVTSRVEGGPQAILECMATGTPILSTPVGIAGLLHPFAIRHDVEAFLAALAAPMPDLRDHHRQTVQDFDIRAVVRRYDAALAAFVGAWRTNRRDFAGLCPELGWHLPAARR